MNKGFMWALMLVLFSINASAQNITEKNVAQSQAIIEKALKAYGGREAFENLTTVMVESDSNGYAVGQSRAPGPPWDKNSFSSVSSIDLKNRQLSGRFIDDPEHYRFDQGQIITSKNAWQMNYLAGTATPINDPDFNTLSGPFTRITAALLVHQLMQRAHTATYLGETIYQDKPHDVLSFVMEVGPAISLYFDKDTYLLSRSERVLQNFGLVEYEFRDYRPVAGIQFNHGYTLYVQGAKNEIRKNLKVSINQPLDSLLAIPKGIRKQKVPATDEPASRKVAEGVYLIGGRGTYALFVEMNDYVIAIGGTGGSEERITLLRESVPDKPIRYGIFTHHHSDHVLAASSYVDAGASLLTHVSHEPVVRTAAGDVDNISMETVTSGKNFSDGNREIQIIDFGPTSHSEHLLVAYLPKERILFSADHFQLPRSGRVAPATTAAKEFAKAIERENLDIKILLSAHSPDNATMKHLRKALKTQPKFRNSF